MRKELFAGTCVLVLLVILLSGCVEEGTVDKEKDPVHAGNVVEGSNLLAWELYLQLVEENPDLNIFLSPWSISAALAMTFEGAKGNTRKEMLDTLHFPVDNDTRRQGFSDIIEQLNEDDKPYDLATANRLFPSKDFDFKQDYFDILETYYHSDIQKLDYAGNPKSSADTINEWVEEQTNDKIKNIVSPSDLHELTALVLVNAIYFKSSWKYEFDKNDTEDREWTFPDGTKEDISTMFKHDESKKFDYYEDSTCQVLELPYKKDELSMVVLLPKDDDISKLEKKLDPEYISKINEEMTREEVRMYIPKFEVNCKYSLKSTFQKMGMNDAFEGAVSDFTGMMDRDDAHIDFITHKSFIEVNEEGTEAAAATGVGVGCESIEEPETPKFKTFDADHNFIYLIKDNSNENILFLGKLTDPTEGEE